MIPKNENEYIEIATKSFGDFFKLYKINHPYKEKEEEIFKKYYEDSYRFNYNFEEGCISYAKKSWKVLLDTLKKKNVNIYYINWFDNDAFNDEVIRYIEENDMIDELFIQHRIQEIPQLTILKIKKHREFIFKLSSSHIDRQVISYVRSINFKASEIDDYISKTNLTPPCLLSSNFILYLLEENIDNIKYYKGDSPSDELIDYLIEHNYKYCVDHNKCLLQNEKMIEEIIHKADIDIILENDVNLNLNTFDALMFAIRINGHNCKNIKNRFLLNNKIFALRIANYLNVPNPYDLDDQYIISNMGQSLNQLSSIFSDNDIQIIIREIVKSDYYINMLGIIDNIDLNKLKEIYDKLYEKESKFNHNFSFSFFIKVMTYFSNNLSLVKELNIHEITDDIIDNLSLVINSNQYVNYAELESYISIYKEKIAISTDDYYKKICKLLINKDEDIDNFLNDILNLSQLVYLQLEFPSDSIEYNVLESYIELAKLLNFVVKIDQEDLAFVYSELIDEFLPNSLFDFKVIEENILRLYSKIYYDMQGNIDKILQSNKYELINKNKIIDISGKEFLMYSHRENFHIEDDFTGYDVTKKPRYSEKNYLCCEFISDLSFERIGYYKFGWCNDMYNYRFEEPNSLIAFGNRDVFIHHTEKPLVSAMNRFVNPFDMAYFQQNGMARTEFDFLRYDDCNVKLLPKYIIVRNRDEALKLCEKNTNTIILIFDEDKHKNCLINEMNNMLENIETLTYKEIYRLIVLIAKYSCNNYDLSSIQERISKLSDKEQFVLNDALNRYKLIEKNKEKVKIY